MNDIKIINLTDIRSIIKIKFLKNKKKKLEFLFFIITIS